MNFSKVVLAAFVSASFLASCSKDDMTRTPYVKLGTYDSGVLVLNQGGFNGNNASVSYISFDLNTLQNDVFALVNTTTPVLGDTGQDIEFNGDLAYIVLNVSNKIEIVNRYSMVHVATITGLNNPRYIAFANGKGYVTNWGDGSVTTDDYVAVINLATNMVSSTIPVAEGPEKILENAGKLYVAHQGGYSQGHTISVINESNNAVTSIAVADVPNSMQVSNEYLWVLCGGNPSYVSSPSVETAGVLVKINLATNQLANSFSFSGATTHPGNFVTDGASGYYTIGSNVYKFALNAAALPDEPSFTAAASSLYSFAVKNNHIYVGDAVDYSSNGKILMYSTGSANSSGAIGTLEKSYTVGIVPAAFAFNQ